MSRVEILEKLQELFRDVFDDNKLSITENTSSKDIDEWDSLHSLLLFNEIEGVFGVTLTLEETLKMNNVSIICDIIEKHTK